MSIEALLNLIRPTRKNKTQSYLKLFARTVLAVSRNRATILLERHQIRDKDDILYDSAIMNDGAGRISPSLAAKVKEKLGLDFMPSGFQGRLGECKGFWIVELTDKSGVDWIEVYESQRKWTRSSKPGGESEDWSHRIFEVVGHTAPLRSTNLNEQMMAILVEQALDKDAMVKSFERLLQDGLARQLTDLRVAMDNPLLLLKWLYENKSNTTKRLRLGAVQYLGAFPKAIDEKLIMLLNGGFHPLKQLYVKDMAKDMFRYKCDDLIDKLKIRINKSTSVFMVPDFLGVLEENEVFINFSKFDDGSSCTSGPRLDGEEILVSRSPAHFASDIQKVEVVAKAEYLYLEDTIVFSTKGPCLAAKLSGGDYDGDRAWVCWEPSIVNNFKNAEIPICPDLVKLGYIRKVSRTYADLVEGNPNPTSIFLRSSFGFTMGQDMLGKCTAFKEKVCIEQKSVNKREGVWLSTLLSSLVDQYKQGLIFGEDDWEKFKQEEIKVKPRVPAHIDNRSGRRRIDRQSKLIKDRLTVVACDTVDACLEKFHKSFKDDLERADGLTFWDDALAKQYRQCQDLGNASNEWKSLIHDLDEDLAPLMTKWSNYWQKHRPKNPWEEPTGDKEGTVHECYEIFQQIRPHVETPFTQALLLPDPGDPAQSEWALLRASALFDKYRKDFSPFPWSMGGIQLVKLKAKFGGFPLVHTIVSPQYAALKHDSNYIKRYESSKDTAISYENWAANGEDDKDEEDNAEL